MSKRRRCFLPVIGLLAVALLSFTEKGYAQEKTLEECSRLHPGMTSPIEEVTCTSGVEESRKQLNKAYSVLAKAINSPSALASLEKGQKAWLSFRIAQCQYEVAGYSGTEGGSVEISCTARMNRSRASDLEADAQLWKP